MIYRLSFLVCLLFVEEPMKIELQKKKKKKRCERFWGT